MKIFVIGLDCLEYKYVVSWKMNGLKQKFYGIHDVRVAVKRGRLYTPFIWTSFLTGRPAYKYSWDSMKEKERVAWGKLYPLFKLRSLLPINLGLRRFMLKSGLRKREWSLEEAERLEKMPEEARKETFLEEAKRKGYKVWAEEIPAYNDKQVAQYRFNMSNLVDKTIKERKRFVEEVFNFVCDMWDRAVSALEESDLVMFYSPLPDPAHHLFASRRIRHKLILHKIYKKLNDMVANVQNNVVKIVVSDHGFDDKEYTHSEYGFWSSNVELPKKPRTVLDFKNIILQLLEK